MVLAISKDAKLEVMDFWKTVIAVPLNQEELLRSKV
jgi:hypothetical protein